MASGRDFASTTRTGGGSLLPAADDDAQRLQALPAGSRLAEFEVQRFVGQGGFSIVYLAWDHTLDRPVALKEYFPVSLAVRLQGLTVAARSAGASEVFQLGLRSFMKEAKALAQFDHPALVKVYRFWEAYGTAYMVMPFCEGRTLKDTVLAMAKRPDEAWIRGVLAPLTEALEVIHAERWYHRDIAPDNVMLLAGSGTPLLLDFGAARQLVGEHTQALTVILKPGYTPIEQYAEVRGMKQGPWTDTYALAATVYWMISGRTPPPAVSRLLNDEFVAAQQLGASDYSPAFLRAVDRALRVKPEERTRSIEEFRRELGIGALPVRRGHAQARQPARPAPASRPSVVPSAVPSAMPSAAPSATPFATPSAVLSADDDVTVLRPQAPGATPWARPTARAAWTTALSAVAVAGGVAWWWASLHASRSAAQAEAAATAAPLPQGEQLRVGGATASVPASAAADAVARGSDPAPEPQPAQRGAAASPSPPPAAPATDETLARRPAPTPRELAKPPRPQEAQCAALLQRLSLGDSSAELLERLKTLKCR